MGRHLVGGGQLAVVAIHDDDLVAQFLEHPVQFSAKYLPRHRATARRPDRTG
jgi:hypothetical protein